MIKLKDAKCPSCGANIQVNDKLSNTICQYCGSTVLIEEAIEKYKIELSGKVEVDGIKGRNSKISLAKKHMKLNEWYLAKNILLELVSEDPFDTEAYINLVKTDLNLLKDMSLASDIGDLRLITDISNYYDRIKKIDEEHIADKELEDVSELYEYYLDLKAQCDEFYSQQDKVEKYLEEALNISNKCHLEVSTRIGEYFNNLKEANVDNKVEYLKHEFDEFIPTIELYIYQCSQEKNKEIDKKNKKIEFSNNITRTKNAFRIVRIILWAIIGIALILSTIACFVTKEIASGIVLVIFVDSWLLPVAYTRIDDLRYSLENMRDLIKK